MDDNHNMARCKQCDHLLSFHGEDGCGTWLLGVRAVPLYRCACVVSVSAKPKTFPIIPTRTFETPAPKETAGDYPKEIKANVAKLKPASEAAPPAARDRLLQVAAELRRTAAELKELENVLARALNRFSSLHNPAPAGLGVRLNGERRASNDRRKNNYAMTVERRVSDRRTVAA